MEIDFITFKYGPYLISTSEFNKTYIYIYIYNIYIYIYIYIYNIYIYIYTTATFAYGSSEYLAYSVIHTPSPPRLSHFKDHLFTCNTKNYNT